MIYNKRIDFFIKRFSCSRGSCAHTDKSCHCSVRRNMLFTVTKEAGKVHQSLAFHDFLSLLFPGDQFSQNYIHSFTSKVFEFGIYHSFDSENIKAMFCYKTLWGTFLTLSVNLIFQFPVHILHTSVLPNILRNKTQIFLTANCLGHVLKSSNCGTQFFPEKNPEFM